MLWLGKLRFGETLIFLTGILLLGNVLFISQTGDFTYWVAAKLAYVLGVLLFIFEK